MMPARKAVRDEIGAALRQFGVS
eukprot:SAG31_NODE_39714_length_286_cov_0.823529_1_plen_22_part_01